MTREFLAALATILVLLAGYEAAAETRAADGTDAPTTIRMETRAGDGTAAPTTLKAGPTVGTAGFKCYDNDGDPFCACESLDDCEAMIKSGKCTGDVEVHEEDPPDATCDTNSADLPTGPSSPTRLSSGSARTTAAAAATMGLAGSRPGGTEFNCSYNDKGEKTGCSCDVFSDCINMMKQKVCGDWDVKKDGKGGKCGNP